MYATSFLHLTQDAVAALGGAMDPHPHAAGGLHDPHAPRSDPFYKYGLYLPVYAMLLAVVSGLSMPIGAVLGIKLSPVSDTSCSMMIAFGAGSLLFAVTVELYGHALHEVSVGRMKEWQMLIIVFGALLGAVLYIQINRALEAYFEAQAEQEIEEAEEEAAVSRVESLESYGSMASSDKAAPTVHHSDPVLGRAKTVLIRSRSSVTGGALVPSPLASQPLMRHSEAGPRVHRGLVDSLKEIKDLQARNKAKMHWKKLRLAVKQMFLLSFLRKKANSAHDTKEDQFMKDLSKSWQQTKDQVEEVVEDSEDHALKRAKLVAYSLFLGLVVDGIPEGILMGFLAAEGHLTPVFVISLFVANFPEAFSSASLLVTAKMSYASIVGMWTGLTMLVGLLAGLSCWLIVAFNPRVVLGEELPPSVQVGVCLTEGITGGAMIACIASVMLPEAFERCSKHGSVFQSSGFICVCGFLMAVTMKTLGG